MLRVFKKTKPQALSLEKLQALTRLTKENPPFTEGFLDTLNYTVRLLEGKGAALYLYESKTDVFLLKMWSGTKPGRYTLAADYEFIKYLKTHENPAARAEFVHGAHELRQTALFFFQQTSSTHVYPICHNQQWLGLLTLDFEDVPETEFALTDQILMLYSEQIKTWLLYQRAEERSKKLSELGHVKNQLLANVTHELQTPLNGILGVAEAVLSGGDGPVNENMREHLTMICSSGRELSQTVNNILKLIHIEAHKHEVKYEKVSIVSLIEEVLFLYQKALREKNIHCEVPAVENTYTIFVEPDQIRTVLMNLIGNALKFTQDGRITITLAKNGEMLHVSVADTGIGIDDDKLELIFEEFYQVDGSHTRVYGGTGLGLAIVKKIITLHGGRIWAESRKGQGSKFTFTIPIFPI